MSPILKNEQMQNEKLEVKPTANPLLIRKPETFKMPSSDVLSRLKSFLPIIENSNMELLNSLKDGSIKQEDVDIENVDNEDEAIQMNFGFIGDQVESDPVEISKEDEKPDKPLITIID